MISVGKEFAKIPTNSVVRNTEAEGEEQSGLLKKFKDIMLKQRPESVSHLLQDNLPKCKTVWQYLSGLIPCDYFFFPPYVLKSLSHFSCIHLPVWPVLWEKDRWKEERSYLPSVQNGEPKGADLSHGRWLLWFPDHQERGVCVVQQWLPGHESSPSCVRSGYVSRAAFLRDGYRLWVLCRSFCGQASEELITLCCISCCLCYSWSN